MDIISHTLSGIAIGTVVATISNVNWKQKSKIILTGGLGGALPDIDAISLWSNFDSTIGSFLVLEHSGKEIYSGKFWYSHHAALHSLLAPIVFIIFSLLLTSIFRKNLNLIDLRNQIRRKKYLLVAFFLGFIIHLLEDMPTPSSVWGGVNLFYPSDKYIGGFGDIWWWNNYDLVLIVTSVIILNLLCNIVPNKYRKIKARIAITAFSLGIALFIFQIKTRPVDFNYTGHTSNYAKFESQSKQIQQEILGDKLFGIMSSIDNKIPLNF